MLTAYPVVLVVVFAAFFFVGVRRRQAALRSPDPDRRRRLDRWTFYSFGLACCWLIPYWVAHREWFSAGCFGFALLSIAYTAFRRPTEQDYRRHFALHPGRCGRCGYDLTGNVTGVCPECGWAIPSSPVACERPDWPVWWHGWRIDHLDNWKRALWQMVLFALAFGALAVWFLVSGNPAAIFPAFMCLHFVLNTLRVIDYGTDRKRQNPDGSGASTA
ncbi:MAG TPA: hypothetical protein PLC79_00480 [Phycisphaerae bacterium]|nr:hypothetical protein [Phycisphaerae bacterium]